MRAIVSMGLRTRVVCHVRCVTADVEEAISCGVDGLHLFFGTSPYLRAFSHGQSLDYVRKAAIEQVQRVQAAGLF
ncbi:hypothetical protein ACKI1K_46345, partial [Streptomyces scabiei]|uniref:hypothetical protein n=1 Tax=Streptomyces scabiei TaxID=1930 RepID=UPI0038F77964